MKLVVVVVVAAASELATLAHSLFQLYSRPELATVQFAPPAEVVAGSSQRPSKHKAHSPDR